MVVSMPEQYTPDPELVRRLEGYLEARSPDEVLVYIGAREVRKADLLDEVRKGTKFGCEFLESMVAVDKGIPPGTY
jgi:hypothetical protein